MLLEHVVEPVRPSRAQLPKEVLKKLRYGEIVVIEKNHGILVLKWCDTRNVHFPSTKHGAVMEETQRKRRKSDSDANTPSTSAEQELQPQDQS